MGFEHRTAGALLIFAFGLSFLVLFGELDRLALVVLFGGIGFVGFAGCIVIGMYAMVNMLRERRGRDEK